VRDWILEVSQPLTTFLLYSRFLNEMNDKGNNKDDGTVDNWNERAFVSAIYYSRREGGNIARIWFHSSQIVKHLIETQKTEE